MVEVSHLTKRYGSVTAVQDVSFQVRAGETFALLGPNGSGKTTILKCLAGLVLPSGGSIKIRGMEMRENAKPAKALLSYLPQRSAFPENLSARELLDFYARLRRIAPERSGLVPGKLGFGMNGFESRPVGGFSGGMIQRLAIAIALLPESPLLVLDEPAVSLDPEGAIRFREALLALKTAGRTILFSSHELSDVDLLADRVAVLVSGRLVALETVERLRGELSAGARLRIWFRNPEPRFAAAALSAGASSAVLSEDTLAVASGPQARLAILRAIEQAGGVIERFSTEEVTLEEVYLRYVNENSPDSGGDPAGPVRDGPAPAG